MSLRDGRIYQEMNNTNSHAGPTDLVGPYLNDWSEHVTV